MSTENLKEIVEKVNLAFSNNDIEAFLSYCADDVIWYMSGPVYSGKEAVRQVFTGMPAAGPMEITVKQIIAEGDAVMAEGAMKMAKKDGGIYQGVYCDVYSFKEGRIKELRSYVVETK